MIDMEIKLLLMSEIVESTKSLSIDRSGGRAQNSRVACRFHLQDQLMLPNNDKFPLSFFSGNAMLPTV